MRNILIAGFISMSVATTAMAQTTAPPPSASAPAATKTTPKTKTPDKARSAESIECSKQADAKGLHGKERKAFRAKCKKDLKAKKT